MYWITGSIHYRPSYLCFVNPLRNTDRPVAEIMKQFSVVQPPCFVLNRSWIIKVICLLHLYTNMDLYQLKQTFYPIVNSYRGTITTCNIKTLLEGFLWVYLYIRYNTYSKLFYYYLSCMYVYCIYRTRVIIT